MWHLSEDQKAEKPGMRRAEEKEMGVRRRGTPSAKNLSEEKE